MQLERVKGIEPSYAAWEAAVLPLNYTRADNSKSEEYIQFSDVTGIQVSSRHGENRSSSLTSRSCRPSSRDHLSCVSRTLRLAAMP